MQHSSMRLLINDVGDLFPSKSCTKDFGNMRLRHQHQWAVALVVWRLADALHDNDNSVQGCWVALTAWSLAEQQLLIRIWC